MPFSLGDGKREMMTEHRGAYKKIEYLDCNKLTTDQLTRWVAFWFAFLLVYISHFSRQHNSVLVLLFFLCCLRGGAGWHAPDLKRNMFLTHLLGRLDWWYWPLVLHKGPDGAESGEFFGTRSRIGHIRLKPPTSATCINYRFGCRNGSTSVSLESL